MQKQLSESQYNRITIKKYIVWYYGTRPDKFSSLCFEDEDESDDNLRTVFDGLPQNLGFESKIEQLILTSLRIKKYEKLVQLLQQNNPKFDLSIIEITNPTISSPSTKTGSGPGGKPRSNAWTKQSTQHRLVEPAVTQPTIYENADTQVDVPQIDTFRQDLARLDKNISLLGETERLLETMSQIIRDLLLDVKVRRQMVQNEQMKATTKSNTFHSEQKADSHVSKPALIRQPFSSPSGSSWQETTFAKPN
ncbi:hypothetical protein [Candidatus Leptofilum sp.]|uniref:hypothetical protein n=1 Tax=Candidatus Leptofilum sp. TaxID=3241576 RepID=UPI003B59E1EA